MLDVQLLVWDDWNVEHIARHDVLPDEVEDVCYGEPVVFQTYQQRLLVVGVTRRHRVLGVVLEPVDNGMYYVVTSRPASRKERRLYTESKGGIET